MANTLQNVSIQQFLQMTQAHYQPIGSPQPFVDGGTVSFQQNQYGLGIKTWLHCTGTVTVAGTVSGGTFALWPYPAPMGVIKNIQFSSGSGVLRNHSLFSLYKWLRYRTGLDFFTTSTGSDYSNSSKVALGQQANIGHNLIVGGNNVAAGTYDLNFALPMPLAYNEAGELAQLNFQNSSRYTWQLQLGNLAAGISATGGTNDLFTALTGTGLSVTVNLTFSMETEYFDIPVGVNIQPFTSQAMVLLDQLFPIQNGQNTLTVPSQNIFTMLIMGAYNGGSGIYSPQVSNVALEFSNNFLNNETGAANQIRNYEQHRGTHNIDGDYVMDLGIRKGDCWRRDIIDSFNNSNTTNLTCSLTTSATITGVSGILLTTESLQPLVNAVAA